MVDITEQPYPKGTNSDREGSQISKKVTTESGDALECLARSFESSAKR